MELLSENKFIINCSRISTGNLIDQEIRKAVLGVDLDWEAIYKKANQHKVIPMIYHHLRRLKLLLSLNMEVKNKFEAIYRENKLRNGIYFDELWLILDAFKSQNIKAVLTKGAYLVLLIYRDPALRYFIDIDILVRREDFMRACSLIEDLGYTNGKYNRDECKIFRMNKEERLFWQKFLGHLPFSKMSDSQHCKVINIEIHYDFFAEARHKGITNNMIDHTDNITLRNRNLSCLNEINMLIHQCWDLFKDIYDMKKIKHNSNLRISKFCDIYEIINMYKTKINWNVFIKTVSDNRLKLPVYLCFVHINLVYGEVISKRILRQLMPDCEDLTSEFKGVHIEEEKMRFFNNNMVYDLFNNNKQHIIKRLAEIRVANFKNRVDSYRDSIRKLLATNAKN